MIQSRLVRKVRTATVFVVATAWLTPTPGFAQGAGSTTPTGGPPIAAIGFGASPRQGGARTAEQGRRVLSIREALQRGVDYNVTVAGLIHAADQARGRQTIARSALMPNVSADASATEQQVNLAAIGVSLNIPGNPFDPAVRFGVVDARARLSQTVLNLTSTNNYRAAQQALRASELSLEDSRDVIVLAVGTAYLEALASRARLDATLAQVETATSIHDKAVQQRTA